MPCILGLIGCGRYYWSNPNATAEQFGLGGVAVREADTSAVRPEGT